MLSGCVFGWEGVKDAHGNTARGGTWFAPPSGLPRGSGSLSLQASVQGEAGDAARARCTFAFHCQYPHRAATSASQPSHPPRLFVAFLYAADVRL